VSQPWRKLRVEIDGDTLDEIAGLPRAVEAEILGAIDRYSDTGEGGPPAREYYSVTSMRVGMIDLYVAIDPDNPKGPTLIISEICTVDDESGSLD
jgi:hypothetical protein